VHLDFKTDAIGTIPFPPNFALVIADSGRKHNLLQSHYNARREECAAAAQGLGVRSLRDVAPEQLQQARALLDPLLYKRAAHIVGENSRVWQAIEALRASDAAAIGALMNASHESSRTSFENSTPELDMLVDVARSLAGVLGSRLTGGGFGGGTVTLVHAAQAEAVAEQIGRAYAARSGYSTSPFVCRIADGAAAQWDMR
jgi:galactokinase